MRPERQPGERVGTTTGGNPRFDRGGAQSSASGSMSGNITDMNPKVEKSTMREG